MSYVYVTQSLIKIKDKTSENPRTPKSSCSPSSMDEITVFSKFAISDLISLFYCGNLYKSLRTKDPLKKDLVLIAKVSNLIFRNPRSFPTKYQRGLRECCWHGKQWVFGSTKAIDHSDPTVTCTVFDFVEASVSV